MGWWGGGGQTLAWSSPRRRDSSMLLNEKSGMILIEFCSFCLSSSDYWKLCTDEQRYAEANECDGENVPEYGRRE